MWFKVKCLKLCLYKQKWNDDNYNIFKMFVTASRDYVWWNQRIVFVYIII